MKLYTPTLDLEKVYSEMGYTFFGQGQFNLNIFGIRNTHRKSNLYDDWIGLCFMDAVEWRLIVFPCTTDPGDYYLEHPMSPGGAAIMCPGQYPGAYKIGLHLGQFPALIQSGNLRIWRDNNGDHILDTKGKIETWGPEAGINIHCVHNFPPAKVGMMSAGCQDFLYPEDHHYFMALVNKSAMIYGNSFTYTLFDEVDFE